MMLAENQFTFLLASEEPALMAAMEPVIAALGARAEIVLTAEAAFATMTAFHPPVLALLDAKLLGAQANPGRSMDQLLTSVRASVSARRMPIALIADSITQEIVARQVEGVIDDVLLRSSEPAYWRLRLDSLLRTASIAREVETLREAAVVNSQIDRLTGVFNRETLITMLFRETDRVQRMQSSMSLILFDVDDFGHWNSRLGAEVCDDLLCQVVARTCRLLRSYDLLGRPGKDEFLIALPGCTPANTFLMAERLRVDVFSEPFHVEGESIRLSACFGIAVSNGRSPVVVLREAEQALNEAKAAGPESIQCFSDSLHPAAAPVTFLSPSSGDELLAW
jgi:diguanylate cyclase (GGDEF)-like protein